MDSLSLIFCYSTIYSKSWHTLVCLLPLDWGPFRCQQVRGTCSGMPVPILAGQIFLRLLPSCLHCCVSVCVCFCVYTHRSRECGETTRAVVLPLASQLIFLFLVTFFHFWGSAMKSLTFPPQPLFLILGSFFPSALFFHMLIRIFSFSEICWNLACADCSH